MIKTILVHVDGGPRQASRLRTAALLAREHAAHLVGSGAFGHSRYREWMLGGTTRELLEGAPVPLLIAH